MVNLHIHTHTPQLCYSKINTHGKAWTILLHSVVITYNNFKESFMYLNKAYRQH